MNYKPSVYVVVVTYQPKHWLTLCFESLKSSVFPVQIIAVDNNSSDDTCKRINTEFPEVTLIQNSVNFGFAKANNQGISKALDLGADYIFLLNQDARVEPNTIGELVKLHLSNGDFGIMSPIHLNGDGSLLDYGFYNYISRLNDEGRLLYSDLLLKRALKLVYEVEFVNAAAWLISKKCITDVGVFDDELFAHYGEDDNYLNRVRFFGFRVGVCPNARIYHDREDREGKKAESIFVGTLDGLIRPFLTNGSDPNFGNRFNWMEKQMRNTKLNILRSLLLLRIGRLRLYIKLLSRQNRSFNILKSRTLA